MDTDGIHKPALTLARLEEVAAEVFAEDLLESLPRHQVQLMLTYWMEEHVREFFLTGQDFAPEVATALNQPVTARQEGSQPDRFHCLPTRACWYPAIGQIGIRFNALSWHVEWWAGGLPVPKPPMCHQCWILPTNQKYAELIARWQQELRAQGWKVLTSSKDLVAELGNKAGLHRLAAQRGLLECMPRHFASPRVAAYPCIVKPVDGEYGQRTVIVKSLKEAQRIEACLEEAGSRLSESYVLQELVVGAHEFATSMLVKDGELYDAVTTEYVYENSEYFYPMCRERWRRFYDPAPRAHLRALSPFLKDFSGICNANYKVCSNGFRLFEINVRMGGDLATDVMPRSRVGDFISKLDELDGGWLKPLDLIADSVADVGNPSDWTVPPKATEANACWNLQEED